MGPGRGGGPPSGPGLTVKSGLGWVAGTTCGGAWPMPSCTSTRRLEAFLTPSPVGIAGRVSPAESASRATICASVTPSAVRASRSAACTASARCCPRASLSSSPPDVSVWPVMWIVALALTRMPRCILMLQASVLIFSRWAAVSAALFSANADSVVVDWRVSARASGPAARLGSGCACSDIGAPPRASSDTPLARCPKPAPRPRPRAIRRHRPGRREIAEPHAPVRGRAGDGPIATRVRSARRQRPHDCPAHRPPRPPTAPRGPLRHPHAHAPR